MTRQERMLFEGPQKAQLVLNKVQINAKNVLVLSHLFT